MSGLLKFITCGSVDDGKSTLIGHILYDSKLLYADQKEALILDSKVGSRAGAIDYSLLLDGLMAEREQGITIDVAYRYFTTDKRSFIVADTPGHEEYTRNMAVGASFAHLSIILIDAKQGVLVQTRRHARICSLMGITSFVFAINKMDLVGYSQQRFQEIETEIQALAQELGLRTIQIIPVSATEGDNVTKKSENIPWYEGKSLLSYLEDVEIEEDTSSEGFYLPVQRVCRPNHTFRGFQGQIETGTVRTGQEVYLLPSRETAVVKSILVGDKTEELAEAGSPVTIQLDREVDVSRGCVITDFKEIPVTKQVRTTLLWMDDEPLSSGKEYLVKLGTRMIPGVIRSISYQINVNTGAHEPVTEVRKNEIIDCEIEFSEKIVADTFRQNKTLGELILIDRITHMTSACGVVEEILETKEIPYFEQDGIQADGSVFEEFYFNIEKENLIRQQQEKKTYHTGDPVPVKGESYRYPENFDILIAGSKVAVQIRNARIAAILELKDYHYENLPITDERGFALQIFDTADLEDFKSGLAVNGNVAEFHNKWTKFETFRKIVFNDNYWII